MSDRAPSDAAGGTRWTGDQLRDLLARRARALSEDAVRSEGEITTEQVRALARLARLSRICETLERPPKRKRWPVLVLAAVTLLVLSIVLFVPVSETEIELDVTLSEASFVLATPQVLADAVELSVLGLSGVQRVQLPPVDAPGWHALAAGEAGPVQLAVATHGTRRGAITLARLALPAGSRAWLRSTEAPRQYRLSLKGLTQAFRIDVNGPIDVAGGFGPGGTVDFGSPAPITVHPDADQVDLDLTLPEGTRPRFLPQIQVRDLSLFSIEGFMDPASSGVRSLSSVLAGTLYFESLNGVQRALRPGEGIRFGGSRGEIRTLRLDDGRVALDFRGHVREMTTGSDENRRNLMPTILEWLRARQGLALLWGTMLYVLGVVMTALRWWRNPT